MMELNLLAEPNRGSDPKEAKEEAKGVRLKTALSGKILQKGGVKFG